MKKIIAEIYTVNDEVYTASYEFDEMETGSVIAWDLKPSALLIEGVCDPLLKFGNKNICFIKNADFKCVEYREVTK